MSEGIENKIKQTFEDFIIVKQKVIDGGEALKYCNTELIVPDKVPARIQESHITAGHALLQYAKDKLFETAWLNVDK
ncbi:hypothetical protein OAP03_00610 [Gammaproteobacteria bacterium]|nr:hypothetical protein [Gammaproteobacteria bacterium]